MEYIKRILNISNDLERKSQFLFGPRQTGKTTWITHQLENAKYRFNLLDNNLARRLSTDPSILAMTLRQKNITSGIVVIDEIQKLPFLLDEVHNLIETTDIKFLLTGSSARKLREKGVNLLGGRAGWKEMYPLVFPEINNTPDYSLERIFHTGLIPSIYLSSNPDSDLSDYVNLYLSQEIQQEGLVRNLPAFFRFIEVAALSNTEMLNYDNIAKETGISSKGVAEWFKILYDTLVAFEVPAYRKTVKRKAFATSKFYFFDLGIVRNILNITKIDDNTSEFGKYFEAFIASELRAYIGYTNKRDRLNYWRSLSGFEVDFVIPDKIAIETKTTKHFSSSDIKGLKSLKEEGLFPRYILVCREEYAMKTEDGIEILPWKDFLSELWKGKIF